MNVSTTDFKLVTVIALLWLWFFRQFLFVLLLHGLIFSITNIYIFYCIILCLGLSKPISCSRNIFLNTSVSWILIYFLDFPDFLSSTHISYTVLHIMYIIQFWKSLISWIVERVGRPNFWGRNVILHYTVYLQIYSWLKV